MNLEVVVLGRSLPLERCLGQIGTPFRTLKMDDPVPQESAASVVVSDSPEVLALAGRLLSQGLAVIMPESFCGRLDSGPLRFTYPDHLLCFSEERIRKQFDVAGLHPTESVAVRSTALTVFFFLKLLTQVFEVQGLLFPALGFYPSGKRSLFSCRIDADEWDEAVCDPFFRKLKPYSRGVSVFFSAANYSGSPNTIRDCAAAGAEVLSHGYYHYTYRSARQNRLNLAKASEFLNGLGIFSRGFAAPHGRWNQGLQKVLEDLGYLYSSDFSYDYDSFPSYPFSRDGFSRVLQIPIHPVCSGVCLEASRSGFTHQILLPYFKDVFLRKYYAGLPVIFYDHPTAWAVENFKLIEKWFDLAKEFSDVWICPMGDFATWWSQRTEVNVRLDQSPHGSTVRISCETLPRSSQLFSLNLFRQDASEYAPVGLREGVSNFDVSGASFLKRETGAPDAAIPVFERKWSLRLKATVKEFLDWETTTPSDLLLADDFSSFLKKMARLSFDRVRLRHNDQNCEQKGKTKSLRNKIFIERNQR